MENTLKKKIFIVDDETSIRDLFKSILTKEGYAVEVFPNTEGLLSYVLSSPPDLLIMDLILPWEHGEVFIQRFKSIETKIDFPIIVISGKKMLSQEIENLKTAGVVRFFAKPFDINEIITTLSQLLS